MHGGRFLVVPILSATVVCIGTLPRRCSLDYRRRGLFSGVPCPALCRLPCVGCPVSAALCRLPCVGCPVSAALCRLPSVGCPLSAGLFFVGPAGTLVCSFIHGIMQSLEQQYKSRILICTTPSTITSSVASSSFFSINTRSTLSDGKHSDYSSNNEFVGTI